MRLWWTDGGAWSSSAAITLNISDDRRSGDIVVEPNIVRATVREPALARPPAFAEQLEAALDALAPSRPQQEPVSQYTEPEPPVPRPVDRLASDQPARETAPFAAREPQPPGAAADAMFTPAAEYNSAETAQRLVEAVLLRRRQSRSGLAPSPETQSDPRSGS